MDDYRVKGRSDEEVRKLAKKAREFFGVANHTYLDILKCLKRGTIWTVDGIKRLNFQVRPDDEMGMVDGTTLHYKGVVNVAVKQSVYNHALMGDGRARNTSAHELGHAVLGHTSRRDDVAMHRRSFGNVTPKWIKPFESAEHQVNVFAPALLINDIMAETLRSAEEISIQFGISLESALIYFERLTALRAREKNAEKIRRIAEDFCKSETESWPKIHYLDVACTSCGHKTLFPVGSKYMCQTCDRVFDSFSDGDSAGA